MTPVVLPRFFTGERSSAEATAANGPTSVGHSAITGKRRNGEQFRVWLDASSPSPQPSSTVVTPVVPPRFFTGERTLAEIAEIAKTTDAKRAEIRAAKRDMVLSSMDITSLYPNIPLDDALRVIRILLMELPHLYDFGRDCFFA